MAKVTPLEMLAPYNPGEFLNHGDLNALIAQAKSRMGFGVGLHQPGMSATTNYVPQPRVIFLTNETGQTIAPYSVFGFGGAEAFSDPPRGKLRIPGRTTGASFLQFYTNGPIEIPSDAGAQLIGIPIGYDNPQWLLCKPDSIPEVGQPCGVDLEQMRLCKHRYGFVCMTKPQYFDGSGDALPSDVGASTARIFACRTRDIVSIVGKVTVAITAYNPTTKVLGFGKAKIHIRDDADGEKLKVASNNAAAEYEIDIWNYHETAFAVDTIMAFEETLGIGLTPIAPASAGGLYFAQLQTSPTPTRSSPEVDAAESYIIDPIETIGTPKFSDMLIYGPPDSTGILPAAVSGRVLNYTPFGYYGGSNHRLEVIKTGSVYIIRKPQTAARQPNGSLEFTYTDGSYASGDISPGLKVAPSSYSVFARHDFAGGNTVKYLPRTTVEYDVTGYISWKMGALSSLHAPVINFDGFNIIEIQGYELIVFPNVPVGTLEQTGSPGLTFGARADTWRTKSFAGRVSVAYSSALDLITVTIGNMPTPVSSTSLYLRAQLNFRPIW